MASAAHSLRLQIEAALADRIPSALTPAPRVLRPKAPTGIAVLDEALGGGFPLGGITELSGPICSGRTSLALAFLAGLTRAGLVCAWVDVSDTLHPESAAAIGVDLDRLLWIRCGPEAEPLNLPGIHPVVRTETEPSARRAATSARQQPAMGNPHAACCAEPQPTVRKKSREVAPEVRFLNSATQTSHSRPRRPWSSLDQALRAADLLLNAGGFAALVLDMGSVAPEFALRVPLATWFRYRATAERSQASVVLLTQQSCTQSSAGLVLHCEPGSVASDATVFTGTEYRVGIARERFARSAQVTEFTRKPPQSDSGEYYSRAGNSVCWEARTPWAATHAVPFAKAGRP